jgi:cytochrome c oxidase subunit 2
MNVRNAFVMHVTAVAAIATVVLVATAARAQDEPGRVVQIVAQKFHYTPQEIVLKRGEPVVLELTALDFTHGFSVPELGLRSDIPTGKVTRIALTPDKVGTFGFLCDNFCGSGHEEMEGRIRVEE